MLIKNISSFPRNVISSLQRQFCRNISPIQYIVCTCFEFRKVNLKKIRSRKISWEKEKMLIKNISSFPRNVISSLQRQFCRNISPIQYIVCTCFEFRKVNLKKIRSRKISWEKEKMLIKNISSFPRNVISSLQRQFCRNISPIQYIVCTCFEFRKVNLKKIRSRKISWEKEKMLIKNISSFPRNVISSLQRQFCRNISPIQYIVCTCFEFRKVNLKKIRSRKISWEKEKMLIKNISSFPRNVISSLQRQFCRNISPIQYIVCTCFEFRKVNLKKIRSRKISWEKEKMLIKNISSFPRNVISSLQRQFCRNISPIQYIVCTCFEFRKV